MGPLIAPFPGGNKLDQEHVDRENRIGEAGRDVESKRNEGRSPYADILYRTRRSVLRGLATRDEVWLERERLANR